MPAKSKTAVHPASRSKKGDPCYFEKLPAELQVMICDYAYGNEDSNLHSKEEIVNSITSDDNIIRMRLRGPPTFEHTVNQFLVRSSPVINMPQYVP